MHDIDLSKESKPIDAFRSALNSCAPGTKIIYYRGQALGGSSLARAAFNAFAAGQVELVQRRYKNSEKGIFEFIAIKTAR